MNFILRSILLVLVSIVVNTCTDEAVENPNVFSMQKASLEVSNWAEGKINFQHIRGVSQVETIGSAYIVSEQLNGNYSLHITFENNDYLLIRLAKLNSDNNYVFPLKENANAVNTIEFRGKTIPLGRSLLSIEPNPEKDFFTVQVNLFTTTYGTITGIVNSVPLIN